MKFSHFKFAASLIVAAVALPAAAQQQGFYSDFSVGSSKQHLIVDNLGDFNDRTTAWKILGGYGITQYVGVEGGYIELGRARANIAGFSFESKPRTFFAAITGALPVNTQFALTGKAGVAISRTRISDGAGFSTTERYTNSLLGIGATYKFTDKLSLVGEYEDLGKIVKQPGYNLKANVTSIGLRYQF